MNGDSNEIIFVSDEDSSLLKAALDAVSGYENLTPRCLSSSEVIKLFPCKPSKRACFVLSRFDGECFEYLRKLGASIYGPQVILHYVRENKALPNVPYPLYSTALIHTIATVTSVTGAERERILESIQMLHGQASRDLTDDVNVIITSKVGSKKYIVGASRNLHILLPEWISESWRLSSIQDPINMMLPVYTEKYRVPIFSHLVICVSGLSVEERKEVSDLVLKHGGRYSGAMKIGETTHLIVKHASGVKYSHAKKWKIQIVSISWLVDSVSKGYALNEEDFRVPEPKENSSTPTSNSSKCSMSFNNISIISHSNSTTCKVDETRAETFHAETILSTQKNQVCPVLSGCVIMLSDCTREEIQSYSMIIQELGGKLCTELYDQVSETLTHVVVGCSSSNVYFKTREKEVTYVKGSWLTACKTSGVRLSEQEYLITDTDNQIDEEPSMTDECTKLSVDAADLQLINQYFGDGGLAEVDEFNDNTAKQSSDHLPPLLSLEIEKNTNLSVQQNEDLGSTGCFSKLSFSFHEELSIEEVETATRIIKSCGGRIMQLSNNTSFIVSPFFVYKLPKSTHSYEFVTLPWLILCHDGSKLFLDDLHREPAFKPCVRTSDILPLSGCVISLSGFVGKDRNLLTTYAQHLGAIVQECFLRKAVPSRSLEASTHLVAAKPDGRKWPAAKQWGLPAVNRSWLYACAKSWKLVDENNYAVEIDIDSSVVKENQLSVSYSKDSSFTHKTHRTNQGIKEIQLNGFNDREVSNENSLVNLKNLSPNVPLNEVLSTGNLAETMQTPEWVRNPKNSTPSTNASRDSLGLVYKPSPPLSEQVAKCLKNAVSRTAALPKRKLELSDDDADECILRGVVICVAKHLSSRQVELNGIVKQLGGDFKWTYDSQVCTHIIAENFPNNVTYPGTKCLPTTPGTNESNNSSLFADVLSANQDGKYVVKPKWLSDCLVTSRRISESDYLVSAPNIDEKVNEDSTNNREPSAKIPRTTASSLLGDVSRRLELMMGGQSRQAQNNLCGNLQELSINLKQCEPHVIHQEERSPSNLENLEGIIPEPDLESTSSISSPFPTVGAGQRRLRRNPRRSTFVQVARSGVDSNCISSASENKNNGIDCRDLKSSTELDAELNLDLAQPGQSLMVRWQYEDTAPRSTTTTSATTQSNGFTSQVIGTIDSVKKNLGSNLVDMKDNDLSNESNKSEESTDKLQKTNLNYDLESNKLRVISFSGLPSDERDYYADIVVRLGGEVDNQTSLDEKTTHLIVHTPTRSEKCLICLATGKWMLHKSYLDACSRESRWVDEAPYEWGGPGTEPLLMQLSPAPPRPGVGSIAAQQQQNKQQAAQIRDLARSARRWRLAGGNAFQNWRVIFGSGCDKGSSFRRVIEAGGGKVLASSPPYPPASEVTHSFFKYRSNSSLPSLPREYSWLRIDYLCAYLTAGQEVSREDFSI